GKAYGKGCSHHGWIERHGAGERQALRGRRRLRFHHGPEAGGARRGGQADWPERDRRARRRGQSRRPRPPVRYGQAGKGQDRRPVRERRHGRSPPTGQDYRAAFRRDLRPECARHAVYGPEGVAAVQRWRIDLHDRVRCFDQRFSWLQRVCGEQGDAARIRTRMAQRAQGQEYPGERAAPRTDRHTYAGPGSHRGGEADVRIPDPAGKDGSSRRNCGGRAVSGFRRFELREWGGVVCRRWLLCHLMREVPMYDSSKLVQLTQFARVHAGSTVMDVWPGSGDWTRRFSEIAGPTGRVYSFVPAELAHFKSDPVGQMRALAKEPGRENVE